MNNKSFTLIELLVVIVIIGILAGVIMISTSSSIDKANIAKSKVFEESIANDLAANMVSRWRLDQIVGAVAPYTTSDAWGNNTGTLINAPILKNANECVSGSCFSFSGGNRYIECNNDNSLNVRDKITISAWIKPTGLNVNYQGIVVKGALNYGIHLMTGANVDQNKIGIWARLEETWTYLGYSPVVSLNDWNFIVWTYDGLNSKLYNAGNVLSYPRSGNLTYDTNKLRIGLDGPYGGSSFDGFIDDVRIYNAALTSSQIKQNYIAELDSLLSKENISKKDYDQRINKLGYE
ncbi:MAG: LamG-like jellyroll fold domain-containing protein [Acholeplasmataceae bacterium]